MLISKLFSKEHLKKPQIGLVCQFTAQSTYIVTTFFVFGAKRDIWVWLALILFVFILEGLFALDNFRKNKKAQLSIAPLPVANSLFLNIYSASAWPYFLAGLIGMINKNKISYQGRHLFNPALIGGLTVVLLFPKVASYSYDLWTANLGLSLWILVTGIVVTYLARTLLISLSYNAGIILLDLVISKLNHSDSFKTLLFFKSTGFDIGTLWISALMSAGALIFSFHVISDPATAPSGKLQQIYFGTLIAVFDALMRCNKISNSLLISYFLVTSVFLFFKKPISEKAPC